MKRFITLHKPKNNLIRIVICIIMICTVGIANAQVPTTQQQLYITFGGGIIADLSPNAFPITITGSPTPCPDRFGNPNCALKLAVTDYLTIGPSAFFDITAGEDYSISMWYRGYTASISDLEMLFNKTNSGATPIQSDYHLCIYDLNKPFQGYNYSPVTNHFNSPGGGWHHLVAMYNNVGSVWTLYIDNSWVYSYSGPTVTSSPLDPVQIGDAHAGRIDDIVFYDRLLTTTEINQLYTDVNSCAFTCGCPAPTGAHYGGCVSVNTAVLQWTGNVCASSYQVKIKNITTGGPVMTYNTATTSVNIPVIPGDVYKWKVRSVCMATGAVQYSPYSASNTFTAVACLVGDEEARLSAIDGMQLYPNPATDELYLESDVDNGIITIIDAVGRVMLQQQILSNTTVIPVDQLQNGMYIIRIDAGEKSITGKFVKAD